MNLDELVQMAPAGVITAVSRGRSKKDIVTVLESCEIQALAPGTSQKDLEDLAEFYLSLSGKDL